LIKPGRTIEPLASMISRSGGRAGVVAEIGADHGNAIALDQHVAARQAGVGRVTRDDMAIGYQQRHVESPTGRRIRAPIIGGPWGSWP